MAEQITMDRLRNLVRILNQETDARFDYSLESNYDGIRLVRNHESIDVSPRMGKRELYGWIHAYWQGIDIGKYLETDVMR